MLFQVLQQIEDLCLDGHIQRGHRLVQHDKGRLHRQSSREADALPLAAAQAAGQTADGAVRQAHFEQQAGDFRFDFGVAQISMKAQHFAKRCPNRLAGIEG